MPLVVINATIPAGEALSSAIDCGNGTLVWLGMPDDWTEADVTFQVSHDGTTFRDLYNGRGGEVDLVVKPRATIVLPPDMMRSVTWINFRSGTAQNPVLQPEERVFAVGVQQGGFAEVAEPTPKAHRKTPRKTAKARRHR